MDGWMNRSVEVNHTISANAGVSQHDTKEERAVASGNDDPLVES
jgi:hypothetical protein